MPIELAPLLYQNSNMTPTPLRHRLLCAMLATTSALSAVVGVLTPMEAWARPSVQSSNPAKAGEARSPKSAVRGLVSPDLNDEMRTPGKKKAQWSRVHKGQHWMQVVVLVEGAQAEMDSVHNTARSLGGVVQEVHPMVRTLTVSLPSQAVRKLAQHADVLSLTPNVDTQRSASFLESTTATQHGNVRNYTTTTAYTGYDGTGVGIAVLDSGVMKAHRSFQNAAGVTRVKRNVSMLKNNLANWADPWQYSAGSLVPGSSEATQYENSVAADNDLNQDTFGHGTHVASVAAGRAFYQTPDTTGIAPNADIYDVRVLDWAGIGTVSDALEGINWVLTNAKRYNIRVMNLSLAASSRMPWDMDPLANAVRVASSMGITVVVAAGNFGVNLAGQKVYGSVSSPGHAPSALTVGAVNHKGTAARGDDAVNFFSSKGPTRSFLDMGTYKWYDNVIKPDLVAPGNKVIGANSTTANPSAPSSNTLTTLFPALVTAAGGGMTYAQRLIMLSGTSVAAPAVAGATAVLLQANPGLTPPLIKAILQYTAQPLPGYNLVEQGTGLLNLEGAVRLARTLRTDIGTAVEAGTLMQGSSSLLASGQTLPTARYSTVAGNTFNWSRIITVGGSHVVTGDRLFTHHQGVWDHRMVWASDFAVRTDPVWWTGSGIPSKTYPRSFVSNYAATGGLLSSGVVLGDGLLGQSSATAKTGLFTLTPSLSSWFTAGSGVVMAEGVVMSEGVIMSEGVVMSEGVILSEGVMLSEGVILAEGVYMGTLTFSESGSSLAGFNTSGALWGE